MQSLRGHLSRVVFIIVILTGAVFAQNFLPPPEFMPVNFLRVPDITKMTIEKALAITNRHASFFLAPIDAAILHVRVDGEMRDVFIFADVGQQRLMLWQCFPPDADGNRTVEVVTAYYGEEDSPLASVSGIETNARNREFIPSQDVIYVADRGNGQILELAYIPAKEGGQLMVNRVIGKGILHWPVDVAISAYGDADLNTADLYVVDVGTFNQDGELFRFGLKDGNLEGHWKTAMNENGEDFLPFSKPIAVACYPDTLLGVSQIYVVDADNNNLILIKSKTDGIPFSFAAQTLDAAEDLGFKPGGVSLDDFGRVYAVNQRACKIQLFGSELWPQYGNFGKPGTDEPGQLNYPYNIIIDTYYERAEALILEFYDRFSGIQSYLINNAASDRKPALGFINAGLLKPAVGRALALANSFQLGEAYPNPFNSACLISFHVPQPAKVRVDIFNLLGQLVATPLDKEVASGEQLVKFSGDNLSSGIYFYRVSCDGFSKTKKMVLLK
jgi:hypothetical protein